MASGEFLSNLITYNSAKLNLEIICDKKRRIKRKDERKIGLLTEYKNTQSKKLVIKVEY